MAAAHAWAAETFRGWGLAGVQTEPWGEFGRGWERVYYAGNVLTPFPQPLQAHPDAWTGSTDGPARGPVVVVQAETATDLDSYRGTLAGAWLMIQEPPEPDPEFEWVPRRTPLEELLTPPAEERTDELPSPEELARLRARFQAQRELASAALALATDEGAAGVLRPSSRTHGVLRSGGGVAEGRSAGTPEPLPHLVVAAEQYAFMWRSVEAGVPVELEIDVRNRFFEDDLQAYNSLAELPGSDLSDQYVMIGAHLDSWHMGNGAADNAAGSVVMMEAMRILETLGVQPRRTIRIALWSGEEQGLLGSRAWVANHPEMHDRISAYLNVDNGTGRLRGIWDQSNAEAVPVFEQILWPFRDLGVVAVKHGNTGGTDHLAFDAAGIPGFNFIQDPIEYGIRTHHTELDVFDHLMLEDLRQAAVVVAATAYALAMRDEMMPRKPGRAASDR
jgi:hypothetical protein